MMTSILQICPPKWTILLIFPKRSTKTPPYLDLLDIFFKKPTYGCSSSLDDEISGEILCPISKTAVPQQFCQKTIIIVQKRHYLFFRWRLAVFKMRCDFFPGI